MSLQRRTLEYVYTAYYEKRLKYGKHLIPAHRAQGAELYATVNENARCAVLFWIMARPIANKDVVRLIAEMVWNSRAIDAADWIWMRQ